MTAMKVFAPSLSSFSQPANTTRVRRIAATLALGVGVVSLIWSSQTAQPVAAKPPTSIDNPEVVEWIGAHAVRLQTPEAGHGFADMQPLKKMIGDARIVSLGEATHGTREFFQLKHRMLEFLATEMGFTIFSIEANMPEAYRLNDYVLNGKGDPTELIKGMYFWTWDTQEVLDMVRWMREFNKSGKGRVQFTGFDMQTPDVAADIVRDFVDKNDAEYAVSLRKAVDLAKAARPNAGPRFGVATAKFPVEAAVGKRIRYSGYIKTENLSGGYAGLWWRVDGASGMLAFDNMQNRGARGTSDWKRYEIELPVGADARNINFGVIQTGEGNAWFDSLAIEIDGARYTDTSMFDLDFESATPKGFATNGNGFLIDLDRSSFHSGQQSLSIKHSPSPPSPNNFGLATGSFPVTEAAGKRVRFSGYIKTQGVTQGYAGLWWRVDGASGALAFDNMSTRGVTGTTDWQRYEIELPVSAEATNINFGVLFPGSGTAWFDSLAIELDGVPYKAAGDLDLDFESPLLDNVAGVRTPANPKLGFHAGGKGYQADLVADVFHTGKQSLRLKYVGEPTTAATAVEPKLAVTTWQGVVQRLEQSREAFVKKGATPRDVDWIIQNARVVLQCMQMRAGEVSRDRSMAANVKWILDNNPGAKIVLWAHNGHVSTASLGGFEPMGLSLRKMFGPQMVVFGFAFNQGSFRAVDQEKGLRDFTVPPAPSDSLDSTLAATGIPLFALDLRAAPRSGPVGAWMAAPHSSRTIGAIYSQDSGAQYFSKMVAPESFDCLLFVEKTSAARKNP
jgi:erythromycin esterase-like protein